MRHVLIAFMLVMSISSDGFANETQLHWTYLRYDGSIASATLKIDTVRRPQRFTLVLSNFNKSVEVYSVAYSVVSRFEDPGGTRNSCARRSNRQAQGCRAFR